MPHHLKRYKVIYDDFKVKNQKQLQFFLIFFQRVFLFGLIIGTLNSPEIQLGLVILLNFVMLGYIILVRPSKWIIINFELIFNELCLLCLAFLTLALKKIDDPKSKITSHIGSGIIVLNVILMSSTLTLTVIQGGLIVHNAISEYLRDRKKAQTSPQPENQKQVNEEISSLMEKQKLRPLHHTLTERLRIRPKLKLNTQFEDNISEKEQIKSVSTLAEAEYF
jgi:hypothetical protein